VKECVHHAKRTAQSPRTALPGGGGLTCGGSLPVSSTMLTRASMMHTMLSRGAAAAFACKMVERVAALGDWSGVPPSRATGAALLRNQQWRTSSGWSSSKFKSIFSASHASAILSAKDGAPRGNLLAVSVAAAWDMTRGFTDIERHSCSDAPVRTPSGSTHGLT
jgi:hypothetical protein